MKSYLKNTETSKGHTEQRKHNQSNHKRPLMSLKKAIINNPVFRYRYILEMWKLAKVQRWASQHPFFSRWFKMELDVNPAENDAIIIPVQQGLMRGKTWYCLTKS